MQLFFYFEDKWIIGGDKFPFFTPKSPKGDFEKNWLLMTPFRAVLAG
jgi:hypothetical protein